MIATTHVSMILPIYIIFSLLKSCNPDLQHLAFSMHQLLYLQILSHLNISRKVVTIEYSVDIPIVPSAVGNFHFFSWWKFKYKYFKYVNILHKKALFHIYTMHIYTCVCTLTGILTFLCMYIHIYKYMCVLCKNKCTWVQTKT